MHSPRAGTSGAAALVRTLRWALPRGQTLPHDVWQKRHRALFALLCAHAIALPLFGALQGHDAAHAIAHGAGLAVTAAAAFAARRRRRLASVIVSLGLITSSALTVHIAGGVIEAHFHFFVMVTVLSLYEDWRPFLLSAAYVVVHHGLAGALDSHAVYNHPDAVAHPWKWALIHGAFVTAAGLAAVVAWRLNESVREEAVEAYRRAQASERALAAREHETRLILQSAHDAFVAIDQHGVITDWNEQAVATFGWTREEALGRLLAETIIPARHRAAHRHGVERFLATGESIGTRLELVACDRSGREFPVELTVSPLQTADGYVFFAFLHDISERKQAGELLERRRRQLEEAQAVAQLGSWDWDVVADVVEWSDEMCRIYGVDPASHPSGIAAVFEHIHPDDRAFVQAQIDAAHESGRPFSFEHRIVRTDATVRVVSARGNVVVGDDGAATRMFGTEQDITERKEAEEAQRRMAAIVDSSHDAIIATALDGTIVSWNRGAQKMYGYSAGAALGKPTAMLVPVDRRRELTDVLGRIRRGEGFDQLETVRLRRDGRAIEVALTISPIRDGSGALMGSSTIARDISEQKLRERYLRVQHEATRVLAHAASIGEALPALLDAIGHGMGWDVGACWMPVREDAAELRCRAFWHGGARPAAFEEATRRISLPAGADLPGSVWERAGARWVADVAEAAGAVRAREAAADGLHACILLPVIVGDDVLAVIEFLSRDIRFPDAAQLQMLDTLSSPLGQFLRRKRADEQHAHEAVHDALTGLPNRRKLLDDLDSAIAQATEHEPQVLLLLDLDGFKAYNDSFGHAAGDALLTRLGRRLAAQMGGRGTTYRMGGDEFCVIAPLADGDVADLDAHARAALSEHGEAFSVTASCGSATLPAEARTPSEALGLADRRMYAAKGSGSRASAAQQSTEVLLQVLCERSSQLGTHLDHVPELCAAVGRSLAVPDAEMSHLLRAASLHDIGNAAIPEALLDKPGPLDDDEWAFIRSHTLIGERILAAAPALMPAAKLVRSSHERFDGRGYPDGLAGERIPLGARIIAACAAFDAMTARRPQRSPMSVECAQAELHAGAGTQFDAAVVDALIEIVQARVVHADGVMREA